MGNEFWGRDYITIALLAIDDDIKDEFFFLTGNSVESIREEWYRFLITSESHRKADEWAQWWDIVGLSAPDTHTKITKSNSESIDQISATFVVFWDPAKMPFENMAKNIREIKETGTTTMQWQVGKTEPLVGSRVFLMRQGNIKPGLVGTGRTLKTDIFKPKWGHDSKTERQSYTVFEYDGVQYAKFQWDWLSEFPLVNLIELESLTESPDFWAKKGSCLAVPPALALQIEELVKKTKESNKITGPIAWIDNDCIQPFDTIKFLPKDSLGTRDQAEIFASLLVSKDIKPPYAIGLLGDWGVGKSFFMRLMQENVSSMATLGRNADSFSASVSRVSQIEFNAWHYVDSDLWASLATHIFDQLSIELNGKENNVGETRRKLHRQIRSSQIEQDNAEATIESATKARTEALQKLVELETARIEAMAKHENYLHKRIWEAILNIKPDPENEETANWPNLSEFKEEAEKTAKSLGITNAIGSVKEVQRVYTSIKDLYDRGSSLSIIFAWLSGKGICFVILLLLILLVFTLGWQWVLQFFVNILKLSEKFSSNFVSWLIPLSTTVVASATFIGKKIKSVSNAMYYLETITSEINKPRVTSLKPSKEELDIKNQIDEFDSMISTQQKKIEQAEHQISEAQAEIQRINAGGLVYDFLKNRARDIRYLDKLGLISVIRQDFETLGELLKDWKINGKDSIERIILYIDDLDRCPTSRVVEVLQAVHLLLAFDLFVVVVAVDARWLERSLNETYNLKNSFLGISNQNNFTHSFNPYNYLEKIFQIPFHLPAMQEEGYRKLIKNIIESPQSVAIKDNKNINRTEIAEDSEAKDKKAPEPGQQQDVDDEQKTTHGVKDETKGKTDPNHDDLQRELEQEQIKKRIEAMKLKKWEEEFAASLFRFVATPRLAKRLVNIYRLLRVQASKVDSNFDYFTDREKGDYRAVLLLLAINIRFADSAPEILERITYATRGDFLDWLETEANNIDSSLPNLKSDQKSFQIQLRDSLREILKEITYTIKVLLENDAPPLDLSIKKYVQWARIVGRYSFRRLTQL
jgi:hypothetical protein